MYWGVLQESSESYPQVSIDTMLKAAEVLVDRIQVSQTPLCMGDDSWATPKKNKLFLKSQMAFYFREISEGDYGKTTWLLGKEISLPA